MGGSKKHIDTVQCEQTLPSSSSRVREICGDTGPEVGVLGGVFLNTNGLNTKSVEHIVTKQFTEKRRRHSELSTVFTKSVQRASRSYSTKTIVEHSELKQCSHKLGSGTGITNTYSSLLQLGCIVLSTSHTRRW